MSPNIQ